METSGFTAALLCGGPPTIILLRFVRRWWEPPHTHLAGEPEARRGREGRAAFPFQLGARRKETCGGRLENVADPSRDLGVP